MSELIFVALAAGAMLPMQAAINAKLAQSFGSSIWAAAASGAITTLALIAIGLATSRGFPRGGVTAAPSWAWGGGLCGAFALAGMTATAPRLGAAAMIALIVAGQVLFSLVVDQWGLFGLSPLPLTPRRIVAAGLLLAGALLFSLRSDR